MNEQIKNVISSFVMPAGDIEAAPFGNGHINDTLCVTVHAAQGEQQFVLQHVNQYVFKKPIEVIENIEKVTAYLSSVIRAEGGDPVRGTLTLVLLNAKARQAERRVDLSAFSRLGGSASVVRTSGSMESGEHWAQLDALPVTSSGLRVSLPPNSITTLIIEGVSL